MPKRVITLSVFAILAGMLVFMSLKSSGNYALFCFLFILLALVPFLLAFEKRSPQPRELVPIAVLAATAALGRVIFAPFPEVKPTSAIVIITGIVFGPGAGFMTGATAALASNIFFGQGPYTPWQMFAWGIMGFASGLLASKGFLRSAPGICLFGFVFSFLYGWIMDVWQILAFLNGVSVQSALLTFTASFYFDLTHAVSTVIFLLALARPWIKILERVKQKYGLMSVD